MFIQTDAIFLGFLSAFEVEGSKLCHRSDFVKNGEGFTLPAAGEKNFHHPPTELGSPTILLPPHAPLLKNNAAEKRSTT